jgi:NAD(P)-dependent dehydrogenase (short-subunit alcohol dehydrogenase family)
MSQPVVVITGASSGFGLSAAVKLAERGCRVYAGLRFSQRKGLVEEAARAAKVAIDTVQLDVTEPKQIESAVARVVAEAGRLDVLINNAGFGMGGFFEDVSDEELRLQFETNFFGLCAVTRAVLPQMRQQGSGRVLMISSMSGRHANPILSAYCASKFAVEGMSQALRAEVAPFGIDVVLIEPGAYKTDIFGRNMKIAARGDDPASPYFKASQRMKTLVQRYVDRVGRDPEEIGDLIADVATMRRRPALRYAKGPGVRLQLLLPTSAIIAASERFMRSVFSNA